MLKEYERLKYNMEVDETKNTIDQLVMTIHYLAAQIEALDKTVETEDNPDIAQMLIEVILDKGEEFDALAVQLKYTLEGYMQLLKDNKLAIPISYVKLLREVNKNY